MRKVIILLFIFSQIVLAAGCIGGEEDRRLDEFAQCLTDRGTKLYGTYVCPNCLKQKEMFRDSVDKINYIECDPRGENEQSQLCLQKGVERVPMWEFSDGTTMIGVQTLETLSQKTDCSLPENY